MLPANDRPPDIDRTLEKQGLVGGSYYSPSPLLLQPPPHQLHGIQPIRMPPLTEERFMDAFMLFSSYTGIRLYERDFCIEGHQVNPWELHKTVSLRNGFDSVTTNGEWPMVGIDLGFHPVSCGNPHLLAHCTPAVAHQLHQLYQDTLRYFDQAYNRGVINQLEYLHTTGQRHSLAQPQALGRHYQQAYQPTEADYQELLATIAASESSVITFEAKNILPRFCDVSAAELEAHRIPQHVIASLEHNREYLKWQAQNSRFYTGFTPIETPQSVHQNLYDGVQTITPRPSLHFPQDRSQLQERRSAWELMHGDTTNLSPQYRQTISDSRFQVKQGNMTHEQVLGPISTTQAFSGDPGERVRWLPALVSIDNQTNLLRRTIQSEDAPHLHHFNTSICQDPQLQHDSGLSCMFSNSNLLRMDPPRDSQGPGSMQENFSPYLYPDVSSTSASQPPPGPFYDLPVSQLHGLSTCVQGEKDIYTSREGDNQWQFRAKVEQNKALRASQEVINGKVAENGGLTQGAGNGRAQLMGTLGSPYTGVHISSAGAQNPTMQVSTSPAAMNFTRSSSIFTHSPSVSRIRCPTREDLIAAKRWVEVKKRMAFSTISNFDKIVPIQSIPESDVQEYRRNLERLDLVLISIEKYIHVAFAALKKIEVVERLFKMTASAKYQQEELKKPNPRYVLELHTIRGMIQEADNMDKGLKAVLHRIQAPPMSRDGVPSAPQLPPRLDSIIILPPPTSRHDRPQGDDLEPARSPEGVMSHRKGLFDEEVRIAMSKLEV